MLTELLYCAGGVTAVLTELLCGRQVPVCGLVAGADEPVELQQLAVTAGGAVPAAPQLAYSAAASADGAPLVSVPVLSAAGAPLELLVQVPQPAEEAVGGAQQRGDGAGADRPPPKKRLRQKNHVCDICGHRCAFPKDLVRHKFKHTSK